MLLPAEYEIGEDGMLYLSKERDVPICTKPFSIIKIITYKETGEKRFVIRIETSPPQKKECAGTCAAVVRALQTANVYVRAKQFQQFFDKFLALNWSKIEHLEVDAGPESVYEHFLGFVEDIKPFLDEEKWGIIDENQENRTVFLITPLLRDKFFKAVGINDKESQDQVLKYWQAKGWLKTDQQRLTTTETVRRKKRRGHKIILPTDPFSAILNI